MDKKIKLTHPLNIDGRMVAEVTIRRPQVKDLRALEKSREPGAGEIDQGIAMAAVLCGIPVAAIDEMDAGDFAVISEAITGFLPDRPA